MGKKTLVFGASLKPERISNYVIQRLKNKEIDVLAYGLKSGEAFGVSIRDNLSGISDVDTITLYVGPKNQAQYYDTIIALNPKRVIFNPGTENPEFIKILHDKGIETEIACTLTLLATNQY